MIKLFTKENCPYCVMAKELLTSLGANYEIIDVTDNHEKITELFNISQMMTLPQIFLNEVTKENLLGGYSDIKELHDKGKLVEIIHISNKI